MVDRDAETLADQLLALPSVDRARLAELLASIEERDAEASASWAAEINRRTNELDGGRIAGIPAADVFAEVERRLRQ